MNTRLAVVSKAWDLLLDVVYPPRCGGCDRRGTLFCDDCLLLMTPVPDEMHGVKGVDVLICAGAFQTSLREAIHKLKYKSDTPLAKPLARFLFAAISMDELWDEMSADPPTIMCVPLHADRQRSRGFNQSDLIARELSRLTGWALEGGLVRVKPTHSQVGLSMEERRTNVQDAFEWHGGQVPRRVLLVDDVCTTGATLSECASVLAKHGAEHIYAATVAKALSRGSDADS